MEKLILWKWGRQSFRLHDEHNIGNGLNNSTVNQVVGANAIFYADEHW